MFGWECITTAKVTTEHVNVMFFVEPFNFVLFEFLVSFYSHSFPHISFWINFFIKQLQFCIGQVHLLELNRLTTRREYLRSTIDFVRNLILTISAWNYSKGSSKLNRAEDLDMFFLCSTSGVYKDKSTFSLFSLCLPFILFAFGFKSVGASKRKEVDFLYRLFCPK